MSSDSRIVSNPALRRVARKLDRRRHRLVAATSELFDSPSAAAAKAKLAELSRLETEYRSSKVRDERINDHLAALLRRTGINGGTVLEIGGRKHPRGHAFDAVTPGGFSYKNLDLEHSDADTVLGDITGCPEIADNSYDVVLSVDVFEHVDRPWLAAAEISRILKPGGLAYTSTLFSWRYHPCPIDFWRYTPEALEFLFAGLDTVEKDFDTTERRRDQRKQARHDPMAVDALGGWRENIRVFYAGRKPVTAAPSA